MRNTAPNGSYLPIIAKGISAGVDITAKWLVENCGITRRQADNALVWARRLGLIKRTERGHHVPASVEV